MTDTETLEQGWTPAKKELAKTLWMAGESGSQIAGKLGVTRNAVIGAAFRAGLTKRAAAPRYAEEQDRARAPERPQRPAPSMPASTRPRTVKAKAERPLVAPVPITRPDVEDGRITIMQLSDKTCRWPIGDPAHADFCFCGHGPREGSPYCEYHARMAYQPASARQLASRNAQSMVPAFKLQSMGGRAK